MLEALREGMGRQHRREFWEATIAACALVAAPDGKVSFATRVRIDHILDSLPDLKVFDTNEFVELFDRFVDEFRANPRKARAHALEVARKGAKRAEEAELLARVALAVVDTEAAPETIDVEPIEALCEALDIDADAILAPVAAQQQETARPAPKSAARRAPHLRSVETPTEDRPRNQGARLARPHLPVYPAPAVDTGEPPPAATAPERPAFKPAVDVSESELGQQLMVEGTKALIALCGRSRTGALEALRIYENEQIAEADRALAERIAKEKYWLSQVALFPAAGGKAANGEPAPIHVMCLSRPDGSVEALRAFESADHAGADLEFFRSLTNDKLWVSVVQFKTVT